MTKEQKTICIVMLLFVFLTAILALADFYEPAAKETPEELVTSAPITRIEFTAAPNVYLAAEPTDVTEETFTPCYPISNDERILIEAVVMGEAEGEGMEGQMLVAQCILNACKLDNIRPAEAIRNYSYSGFNESASESVGIAVSAVFDEGARIVDDDEMRFFYAPKITKSAWHESRELVIEHGGHRFFK